MGVMHRCSFPGCNKQFDRKYNLKCHLRIHSDEKPYRCHHAHCTRSFRWKSSLNHHLMSLDHTPAAARRERKARAAKRRKQQLATAAAAAQINFESTSTGDRVDASPTSSSNLDNISMLHDGSHLDPGEMDRGVARPLDWSEGGLISGHSSPGSAITSDIEYLNRAQMRMHRSEQRTDDAPLAHSVGLERQSELQINPMLAACRSPQESFRKTQPDLLSSMQMTQHLGLEGKVYRPGVLAAGKQTVPTTNEPLQPRDDASLDSAIDQAMNCMVSSGIKKEYSEIGPLNVRESAIPDMNMTPPHGDWRDANLVSKAPVAGSAVKSQAPLVHVFEYSSHAMLLNAFSPAVDPLFAPCSTDAAGLKGF